MEPQVSLHHNQVTPEPHLLNLDIQGLHHHLNPATLDLPQVWQYNFLYQSLSTGHKA